MPQRSFTKFACLKFSSVAPQNKTFSYSAVWSAFYTTSTCGVGVSVLSDDDSLLRARGYPLGVSASSSWAWCTRSILDDDGVK